MEQETTDINKPGFRPKFTSEFSMGNLDFIRYDKWLMYIEEKSAIINSSQEPDLEIVQQYFAGLNVLYKSWRAIISTPKIIDEIDNAVSQSKRLKRLWEDSLYTGNPINKKLKRDLIDGLDSIHTKLMQIKQVIGLGIVVKKNLSARDRIKAGMNRNINYNNLPEA